VLRVKEVFLFDPNNRRVGPLLHGYRLLGKNYRPIRTVDGRLPSKELALHLEPAEGDLRLYDPLTGEWLLSLAEQTARAKQETERLLREVEEIRRRLEERG
jgi:hypothetical protein